MPIDYEQRREPDKKSTAPEQRRCFGKRLSFRRLITQRLLRLLLSLRFHRDGLYRFHDVCGSYRYLQ